MHSKLDRSSPKAHAPDVHGVARGSIPLYARDFYSWTVQQAELLRSGRLDQADLANLAEEIETLGRAELNALRSRYAVLSLHLLKTAMQPENDGRSWKLTIVEQRIQIGRLLADNPGLKPKRQQLFEEGYGDARKLAIVETGLTAETFPKSPPFTVDQAEDERWRPTSEG